MTMSVCGGCGRHVRTSPIGAVPCPFCGRDVAHVARRGLGRVPRAWRLAGLAAIGVACSGTGGGQDAGGDVHDVSDASVYGADVAPFDASVDVHADANDATVTDASDADAD